MRLIFLGAPGVGKGTIAARFAGHYSILHISTGDIFRSHIKQQTELGKQISAILGSGGLVPDSLTVEIIRDRLSQPGVSSGGYILDGFPRTIVQAEALDTFENIDTVLFFQLSREKIIERLSGRRVHKSSGRIYHVLFNPPQVAGKDDVTGEALMQRPDDHAGAISRRLAVYEEETAPLISYYQDRQKLITIDASPSPEDVFCSVQACLPAY